jgi:hypothetical protein
MRRLAAAKAHLDFDFVPVFQETTRCSDAHLQIVLVGPWPQPHLLDLRHVLVLLCVPCAFVLLEAELAQVSDATHWRICCGGHFDQVEPGLLSTSQRFIERNDTDLLAVLVDDADLGGANLAVGARTGGNRRARIKWTSGNGLVLRDDVERYFFLGPLFCIGGLGAALVVLLPPLLDISRSSVSARWICHSWVFGPVRATLC